MPLVRNCCACMSLKTGTIIIGALDIVGVFIMALLLVLQSTVKVKMIAADISPIAGKVFLYLMLAMGLFISILLIAGAIKRNRWLMLPWLLLTIISLITVLISIIYTCVEWFIQDRVLDGIVWLIVGPVLIALHVYLWIVVFSFYTFLTEQKNRVPY